MTTVILSPHLDDAVLSCWHVLTQPGEVGVITVFAGVPTALTAPAWWDRYTGAADSGERVRERIEEDRRALALAGRTSVNLGFLDEQYRDDEQRLAPLTEQIESLLPPGVGSTPRPRSPITPTTRSSALRRSSCEVRAFRCPCMPTFRTRPFMAGLLGSNEWRRSGSRDLAAAFWDHALAGTGALAPTVYALDGESHERKLAAVRMYRTQLEGLEEFVGRSLADRESLGYEVDWATASPAAAVQHGGRRP